MRILFTCGREPEYPRNAIMRAALERNFNVVSITESSRLLPLRYLKLTARLLRLPWIDHDLVYVGFLGQPLTLLIKKLTRKPILFDAFISVYDTVCFDRNVFAPHSLMGKAAYWLDQTSSNLADLVLLDTSAHAEYFRDTFGIPETRLESVFVGCAEDIFYPRYNQNTIPLVLAYSTYQPLHGMDVIVKAAKLLEREVDLQFRLIGVGREYAPVTRMAKEIGVKNIEFLPPVSIQSLANHISQASICLGGHFGASEKARRVIAGKTIQCLAMGKATIVGENPANHELLTPGYDAWFTPMADPQALANAIMELHKDAALRERLGQNAYRTFREKVSLDPLSERLRQIVERLLCA